MNKKALIKKATLLLKEYQEMTMKMRNYENENWHCVNVKRYHDNVDFAEIIKKYPKKYQEELTNEFNADLNFGEYGLYYNWLEINWNQLNYEITDIVEITKGSKDERASFEYIAEQRDNKMIYCLGRSGGWACFQSDLDYDIENFLSSVIDWDIELINYNEISTENLKEYKKQNNNFWIAFEKDLFDDIKYRLNEIDAIMEEVEYVKNYIYKFNADLDFKEEVKFRIEEKIDEIKIIDKDLAEDKEQLIRDIKIKIYSIQNRLDDHKKNKELKNTLQRHLTGIKKILKD